jgi:hypothetical protein
MTLGRLSSTTTLVIPDALTDSSRGYGSTPGTPGRVGYRLLSPRVPGVEKCYEFTFTEGTEGKSSLYPRPTKLPRHRLFAVTGGVSPPR